MADDNDFLGSCNLADGATIPLPFDVSGTVQANPMSGAKITSLTWQVDDGNIGDAALSPAPPNASEVFSGIRLQGLTAGSSHTLTLTAYDNSPGCTPFILNFQVMQNPRLV